jgi:hypothetical protein
VVGDPLNFNDPGGLAACEVANGEYDEDCGGGGFGGVMRGNGGGNDEPEQVNEERGEITSAYDPLCDEHDDTNSRVIRFLRNNLAAGERLSSETMISVEFTLAWAGFESGYGMGSGAVRNSNFYGLTVPGNVGQTGQGTGGWLGAVSCSDLFSGGGGFHVGFACFPSGHSNDLYLSGRAALLSQNSRYLNPALAAQRSGGGIRDIAAAIAGAGFNSEPIDYGARVSGAGDAIRRRRHCLK